jgi:hypothetical protein
MIFSDISSIVATVKANKYYTLPPQLEITGQEIAMMTRQ